MMRWLKGTLLGLLLWWRVYFDKSDPKDRGQDD